MCTPWSLSLLRPRDTLALHSSLYHSHSTSNKNCGKESTTSVAAFCAHDEQNGDRRTASLAKSEKLVFLCNHCVIPTHQRERDSVKFLSNK